jgi:predicted RND superfamily exporter protein
MLVGSITLGLAVDDTVHFLHNFRRYHQEPGSVSSSVSETLHTTGRAMLFSTIALSIGFFAYTQSSLNNLISFGLITGLIIIIIIIIALLADLLLAPAMMALIYRNSDSHSK